MSDGLAQRAEQAFFPLDQRLALMPYRQTTRPIERMMCVVGMRLPYEQAAEVMRELLGITVTGRQIERVVDWHGQRAIAWRDAEIDAAWQAPLPIGRQPAGPAVLYIEGDGAWINSRGQAHAEGKVGIVHQGSEKVGRTRRRLRSAVYVATFQGSERLEAV